MTTLTACPACSAVPAAQAVAGQGGEVAGDIILSLPNIHCMACINGVERNLRAIPGVAGARVNLHRKRVTVDAEGVTPETLVESLERAGFEAHPLDTDMVIGSHSDDVGRALICRVAVAGFAMMNVMLFSVAVWSGATAATQTLFHWLSAAIAVPALLFSAQVFVVSAWQALRVGRLNMDVPISLAIILATGLSVYETSLGGERVYFDAALSLTFFLLAGRYLDHRTRMAARAASKELSALECPRAVRVTQAGRENVNVSDLQVGDHILVAAGMRIPVDGVVQSGRSDLDRSLLTGESMPVGVEAGVELAAGELNLTAPLTLQVTAVGEDTSLRRMAALIEIAENARNKYTALADRAAAIYAPAVHLLALFTFIGWIIVDGGISHSLNIAISVLIITCPCALGLAVPAVMAAATGRLFRRGLLTKDGTALERLAEVDTVVFDKTGTLTTGRAKLNASEYSDTELSILAALCQASNHPVSQSILSALPTNIQPAVLTDIQEFPGLGVQAIWRGKPVQLGRGDWLQAPASPAFAVHGTFATVIQFSETLREGAVEMVEELRARGMALLMVTGDTQAAAQRVAHELGDIELFAEQMPNDKLDKINALSAEGKRVLMVGDGLNDTAALMAAHASIAPGSALDASRVAADIVLLGESLAEVPEAIRTARASRRRAIENFAIAAMYNAIAIPIAVLGFATPLSAAIAMSLSSISVLLNALRVR